MVLLCLWQFVCRFVGERCSIGKGRRHGEDGDNRTKGQHLCLLFLGECYLLVVDSARTGFLSKMMRLWFMVRIELGLVGVVL